MTATLSSRQPIRRTQAERRDAAARALLDSALALISARGAKGTTLADVGELAGYSRGIAAHYFGSKAGLLRATAEHVLELYGQMLADEGSPPGLQSVLKFVELSCLPRNLEIAKALYRMQKEAFFDAAGLRKVYLRYNRRAAKTLEKEIRSGIAAGEIRPEVDVRAQAAIVLAMTRGIRIQWILAPDDVNLLKVKREAINYVQRVLAGSTGR